MATGGLQNRSSVTWNTTLEELPEKRRVRPSLRRALRPAEQRHGANERHIPATGADINVSNSTALRHGPREGRERVRPVGVGRRATTGSADGGLHARTTAAELHSSHEEAVDLVLVDDDSLRLDRDAHCALLRTVVRRRARCEGPGQAKAVGERRLLYCHSCHWRREHSRILPPNVGFVEEGQ